MSANETDYERATISMPTALLERAKARAKKEHRSFSAHVAKLIESDLQAAAEEASNEDTKEGVAA